MKAKKKEGAGTPSLEFQVSTLVQKAMKRKGMNPTELSRASGVGRATLYRLFRGDGNLTVKTLAMVAWALDTRFRIRSAKRSAKGLARSRTKTRNPKPTPKRPHGKQ